MRALLVFFVLAVTAGCTRDRPLLFVVSPSHAGATDAPRLRAFGEALGTAAGVPIETRIADSERSAIEAFAYGADLGLLNVFGYLVARLELGVEAKLRVLRARGDSYTGAIFVRADSSYQKLEDLRGKTIAYVEPSSMSGFLLPAKHFRDRNLEVRNIFAGDHPRALAMLREGKVDAAATFAGSSTAAGELRAIAQTESIPNEPIFFRRGLDPQVEQKLIEALIAAGKDPARANELRALADIIGFAPTDDRAYEPALALARAAGKTAHDLVPDGWAVRRITEPAVLP